MKIYLILLLFVCSITKLNAQSYTKLADSALHLMWDAKDTADYRNALNVYEKAFKLYPKSIDKTGLYKAAVISAELKELDKSFDFLEKILSINTDLITTWSSLTSRYTASEYKNLLEDKRWPSIVAKAQSMKDVFFKKLKDNQLEFETGRFKTLTFTKAKTGAEVYQMIKSFSDFKSKNQRNYSIKFKVTDSLSTSYFVSLPPNYNPKKSYALMFFLHGAININTLSEYQNESILDDWNRFYTKYAALNQVIMIYPKGSKKYNWMAPDDGFFMIPEMLKEIKQSINIDDDKVFITGHSNGATGSFSYLMKQQNPFAGFYGFNTQPKVRTGGTFIKNILNRSYFNVSTNADYYYPPEANDSLNVVMTDLKADYQDHRYIGWPHWFPQFDESEPVYPMIFRDLAGRNRNAFQPTIYWECDDVKYGKVDWIQINQLDTASKRTDWHKDINFDILKMVNYDQKNDKITTTDTLLKAFNFPRKSGAIKGDYKNNQFNIETSDVKCFSIFISPEMVDVSKPVVVFVNGVKRIERKPIYNKELIISNFKKTYDRKVIWIDKFDIQL